jgi:sugar phosphate isomerase/epimerase
MITRREFGRLTLAGLALPAAGARAAVASGHTATVARRATVVGGVRLGVQTYSFRDMTRPGAALDAVQTIISAMTDCGLTECELFAPQVEPPVPTGGGPRGAPPGTEPMSRDDLRRWRLETPLDHFRAIKEKFAAAGIAIYAYNYSPNQSFSDEEIDRGFQMTRALGAEIITASTTLDVAARIKPFAERHKMVVAMHGHSRVDDPNEFATPESFAAALKMSPFFKVNLDIGHFTAGNYDAIAYIREHHADITNLHLKDRKRNQGDNVQWGEGDTPIRETLQLLKKERWPIRAYVEYEYRGAGSPVEEVKKCYAFARQALA